MRVPTAFIMLILSAPTAAVSLPVGQIAPGTRSAQKSNCPHSASYLANTTSTYRGAPLAPRKLNQLPPGTAYMAVYRRIGECEVPLTVVEYRNPRRR